MAELALMKAFPADDIARLTGGAPCDCGSDGRGNPVRLYWRVDKSSRIEVGGSVLATQSGQPMEFTGNFLSGVMMEGEFRCRIQNREAVFVPVDIRLPGAGGVHFDLSFHRDGSISAGRLANVLDLEVVGGAGGRKPEPDAGIGGADGAESESPPETERSRAPSFAGRRLRFTGGIHFAGDGTVSAGYCADGVFFRGPQFEAEFPPGSFLSFNADGSLHSYSPPVGIGRGERKGRVLGMMGMSVEVEGILIDIAGNGINFHPNGMVSSASPAKGAVLKARNGRILNLASGTGSFLRFHTNGIVRRGVYEVEIPRDGGRPPRIERLVFLCDEEGEVVPPKKSKWF